jgi:hypothetical protein
MLLSIEEKDKVVGEIYKITNIKTNKSYIGQTRSHRLNHNKYRPFGYLGRFKDHIHEANSNKKNQSKYLNSALLKYGSDNFTCERLLTCNVSELDFYETQYISDNNTKYPNGYNLTNGGKGFTDINGKYLCDPYQKKEKSKRISNHSDGTKQLISERLKASLNHDTHREKMMKLSQNQHSNQKFEKFKNVTIDENNIDQYIHIINSETMGTYIRIIINKVRTTFVGKYETIDTITDRARLFILNLLKWQRDQIAGNPLEPSLPLTNGNISEELG